LFTGKKKKKKIRVSYKNVCSNTLPIFYRVMEKLHYYVLVRWIKIPKQTSDTIDEFY